jgi:hypothetical protein
MMIVKFRSNEEHEEAMNKIKKIKQFADELEDCLSQAMEDADYRTYYHRDKDRERTYDDDYMYDERRRGRYDYPRR